MSCPVTERSERVKVKEGNMEDCSTKQLLLADLKKLSCMAQPPMVVNQLAMLLEDLSKVMLCCCSFECIGERRASFPPIDDFTCKECECIRREVYLAMDEKTFGTLFRNPQVLRTDAQTEIGRHNSTSHEGQDICDILDDVHLKNDRSIFLK